MSAYDLCDDSDEQLFNNHYGDPFFDDHDEYPLNGNDLGDDREVHLFNAKDEEAEEENASDEYLFDGNDRCDDRDEYLEHLLMAKDQKTEQ